MHAAGLDSLRLLLWYRAQGDAPDELGTVSSQTGRLEEPYRSNLVHFLTDIHRAGFNSLTVDFGPMGPNDPIGWDRNHNYYGPSLFEQAPFRESRGGATLLRSPRSSVDRAAVSYTALSLFVGTATAGGSWLQLPSRRSPRRASRQLSQRSDTTLSVRGSKSSRTSCNRARRSWNPGAARQRRTDSMLSQGPKLTKRLGSSTSRNSFAREVKPCKALQ